MSYFQGAGGDRPLATPVVTSVVTSFGGDARRARAIRPWSHADYTRWRRAALQALPVALVLAAGLVVVARQSAARPVATAALLVPAALGWLATAWAIARRR